MIPAKYSFQTNFLFNNMIVDKFKQKISISVTTSQTEKNRNRSHSTLILEMNRSSRNSLKQYMKNVAIFTDKVEKAVCFSQFTKNSFHIDFIDSIVLFKEK